MRFTKRGAATLAGLVIALTAVAVAPASATGQAYTTGGDGSAHLVSKGEHFYVHDYEGDRHGVVGYLWAYYSGSWHRITPAGGVYNGNGVNGAPEHRNYSIAEDTYVKYEACLVDGASGTPYDCGGWLYDFT